MPAEKDRIADERDRLADERDRKADQRDREADARDLRAIERREVEVEVQLASDDAGTDDSSLHHGGLFGIDLGRHVAGPAVVVPDDIAPPVPARRAGRTLTQRLAAAAAARRHEPPAEEPAWQE